MTRLRFPSPRLLPLTMAAVAVLLALKSAVLVRAALPGDHAPDAFASGAVVPDALASPPAQGRHAGEAQKPEAAQAGAASRASSAQAAGPREGPPPDPPVSDAERGVLLDLRQRRQALDARAAALATREEVVGAAEKRLADRVTELQALQTRLEALETARHAHDEANWRGLVKLYESMKPRNAATIMNDLDKPVLLAVIDRMKEAKAAAILAAMQPDRAREVTADLARQRTRANTPEGG